MLRIVLPIGGFLLLQTGGAVWWAATLSQRVESLTSQTTEQKALIQALLSKPDVVPLQNQLISQNQKMISDLREQTTSELRDLRDRLMNMERKARESQARP